MDIWDWVLIIFSFSGWFYVLWLMGKIRSLKQTMRGLLFILHMARESGWEPSGMEEQVIVWAKEEADDDGFAADTYDALKDH